MNNKIATLLMIIISTPVSGMEPSAESPNPIDPEQSEIIQEVIPPDKPTFFPRTYQNGWTLTQSLVDPQKALQNPQLKVIFKAKRAIESDDSETLQQLLASKAFDFTPQKGELTSISFALLKCAIKARNPRMCKLLLQAGADVNASSIEEDEGNNILSIACRRAIKKRNFRNIEEICKILLAYGATISKRCIVEAEEERGYLLPLFVRHILTRPNRSTRPDLYVKGFAGQSPIYLKNIEILAALVEKNEIPFAFGGLFKSIQPKTPFFLYGLTELFKSETSHLCFVSESCGEWHAKQMAESIKNMIEIPE